MTIKYLSSILLIIFFFNCNAQGLISNAKTDSDYKKIAPKHSFFSNDAEGLPKKIDLSVYLPSVINQEKWGTCVGISSAYYMRTILEARRLGITDSKKINEISFSPSYLYNAIKDSSNTECYNGTELVKALDFLKNKGIAQLKEQPYPYCGNNIDSIKLRDNSKIMDYIRLFGLTDKEVNVVEAAKKALSEYTPLLVGILTTQSLQKLHFTSTFWARIKHFFGFSLSESEDFRLWKPNKSVSFRGDHAICIVGYDDNKYGGAFQAVN
ncbi:MAG: C1 family peptidase, partial [Bacteroidota bacterium]